MPEPELFFDELNNEQTSDLISPDDVRKFDKNTHLNLLTSIGFIRWNKHQLHGHDAQLSNRAKATLYVND